ncbi:MAG: small multi-drug export protein [Clostridia bacterium]|nr:small multi-drug export protein [Clostridia bacterium]
MLSFIKNYIIVFLVSMVPLIELRGAVPIGTGMGLPWHTTLIVAIIGNCLPIPFILMFVKAVLTWMRKCSIELFNKVSNWMFEKADKNRPKIEKYAAWGLFLFVAIPLPGTGAWTGALVASLFDMNKWKASLSIFSGVVTAGLIMTFGSQAVKYLVGLF